MVKVAKKNLNTFYKVPCVSLCHVEHISFTNDY